MRKNFLSKIPINMKLTFACIIGLLIIGLLYYPLIPKLLNYPPDSINNAFQIKVNYFYYTTQYISIVAFAVIAFLIILPILFRKVNKIDKTSNLGVEKNTDNVISIIKTCFNFPIVMLLTFMILPPLVVFLGLLFLKQEFIFSLKVTFIIFSMCALLALVIYAFSRFLFENVLKKIKITNAKYGIRLNVKNRMLLQLLPLLLYTIVFSFLILYSQLTEIKGDSLYDYYREILVNDFENKTIQSVEEAKNMLEKVSLKSPDDSIFILKSDGEEYYSENELSDFFKTYILDFGEKTNGHTYEYYGDPTQGTFITVNINGEDYILGIRYSVFTNDTIINIVPLFGIVIIINLLFIVIFAINYGNQLKVITKSLSDISKNSSDYVGSKLPVYSNDEIGDLTIAFNNIQDMTKSYIKQLHDNQDTLMEKERLASLGQLIGGIAHNLKTPIMSISGAAEGLDDLIKEYDSSIGDPTVNNDDHHDIAKDMSQWVLKIKNYTEYMSDIITAVKGQAVTLSNEQDVSFTIEELLKRVNILMKHELKNAIIYLNISVKVDENTVIRGDVNSLVQIINNMISNSIQAYNGKPEQNIDLIVEKKENNLVISVKDYGCGIPEKVKEKLFKEMVTTKGKNGTGLGLYMSYSTIRAHFNGNMTVESEEGKGCTFSIILPL